ACLDRALMYNAGFAASLDHQEVRHVARSVAKWTHQHLDAASFSAWQAVQGRKGGKAKGEAYALLRAQALRLRSDGVSIRSIAKELSVGTGTVHSWVSTKR
ncbi:replicase, partial [Pseudomonas sp. FSL R10-1350]